MKENSIKIKLIKYLYRGSKDAVLSSEFSFEHGNRRADLVCQSEGFATAYEIKGAGDSIARLPSQVDSYRKYFDRVYIVCEKNHLASIRQVIPGSIGIYIVSEEGVFRVRKAGTLKRHNKVSLASTLSIPELKMLTSTSRNMSKVMMCELLARQQTLDFIRNKSREAFYIKFKYGSDLLRKEASYIFTSDDVALIMKPLRDTPIASRTTKF